MGSLLLLLTEKITSMELMKASQKFVTVKEKWSNDNSLYQVLMKGRIWLEAYEIHLRTGEDLEKYLAHMSV